MSDIELSVKLDTWIDDNTVDGDFIAHPDFVYDKLLELETKIRKLQAENAELRKQGEWISVDDELPEDNSQVIAWVGSRSLNLTYCDNGYWCEHYGTRCFSKYVTHWMTLPTLPKRG